MPHPLFCALALSLLAACGAQPSLVDNGRWRLDPPPQSASEAGHLQVKEIARSSLIDMYPVTLIATMKTATTLRAADVRVRRGKATIQCAAFFVKGRRVTSVELPVGETEVYLVFDTDPLPTSVVDNAHQATVLETQGAVPASMTLLSAADGPQWRPRAADVFGVQIDWGQARWAARTLRSRPPASFSPPSCNPSSGSSSRGWASALVSSIRAWAR
jgi:hypothetical protein